MAIIKDLAKVSYRCETCGNSKILYFLIKDIAHNMYHFHYLYDFTLEQLKGIPYPTEEDRMKLICEVLFNDNPLRFELVAFYCWGCSKKGLNRFKILSKFKESRETCHYCNKNSYFITDKHLGIIKGLDNIKCGERKG